MWPPFCLTTSCKRTLVSLSRYYILCFCMKQYSFHLLFYSQPPVVRHFTNWWHLSHFPWTTAFTHTFATSILWCYNFNGMIKWYDFSCATLYMWKLFFRGNISLHTVPTRGGGRSQCKLLGPRGPGGCPGGQVSFMCFDFWPVCLCLEAWKICFTLGTPVDKSAVKAYMLFEILCMLYSKLIGKKS